MKLYTATTDVTIGTGAKPVDALAVLIQAIDSLTIVETSDACQVGGGIVSLKVKFWGLNNNEAQATAQNAYRALQTSGGTVRSVDPVVVR